MGYVGIVVEESLTDPQLLNELHIIAFRLTRQPAQWHLFGVRADEATIGKVKAGLKRGWYAHFWNKEQLVVVFADAVFRCDPRDRASWAPAIAHGRTSGISSAQLDFPLDWHEFSG